MTLAHGQDEPGVGAIEGELGVLRAAVEDAVVVGDAASVAIARGKLVVTLASFGSPEFDLEARFHLARHAMHPTPSEPMAIAASLVGGAVHTALDQLAVAVDASVANDPQLLRLAFSAVLRVGASCPELPWLKGLLGRIPDSAERGVAAIELVRFLPQGSQTRADMAGITAECVGALWLASAQIATQLLDMTCRALIDANDQPLLSATADALLRSLPPGHPTERNTLGFLLITSLNNSGDVDASVNAMHGLMEDLVGEAWNRGNFDLLTSIVSVAAEAAKAALAGGANDVATEAVAVADRAFGLIERIDRGSSRRPRRNTATQNTV